jgi:hypothetical protein
VIGNLPHYTLTLDGGRTLCFTYHVTSAGELAQGLSLLPQYRDTPIHVNRIDGPETYRAFTVRNGEVC